MDPQASLPPSARKRLDEIHDRAGQERLFTSDLSVNEFLLVNEAGFEPMGLVVGCSIYQIGMQISAWTQNQEMKVLTQAMYHARELAMSRMDAEATALGADGVTGVRLTVRQLAWGENLAEFLAIGTAVRHKERPGAFRTAAGKPFNSDLSGQDFWTLLRAGYRPVGLVMGTCVYHVAHRSLGRWFKQFGQNTELENFTEALYSARELAMERMQVEALRLHARGIVGARIEEGRYGWASHVLEYFAVGTAVVPIREDHHIPSPQLVMSMDA